MAQRSLAQRTASVVMVNPGEVRVVDTAVLLEAALWLMSGDCLCNV